MKSGKAKGKGGGKGGFNPYRDANGRFASGPGGGGKAPAKKTSSRKAAPKTADLSPVAKTRSGSPARGKSKAPSVSRYVADDKAFNKSIKKYDKKEREAFKADRQKIAEGQKKARRTKIGTRILTGEPGTLLNRAKHSGKRSPEQATKQKAAAAATDRNKRKAAGYKAVATRKRNAAAAAAAPKAATAAKKKYTSPALTSGEPKALKAKRSLAAKAANKRKALGIPKPEKAAKPKSPGLRSQAQRVKQQNKAKAATDRAKLKSLKPKQFVTPFTRSNKNASPAQKLFETMRQTDKVTAPHRAKAAELRAKREAKEAKEAKGKRKGVGRMKDRVNPNPKKAQNNRTPATLSRDAKLIKNAKKARNNASPFVRGSNLKTGDPGMDKALTQTAFLLRKREPKNSKLFDRARFKLKKINRRANVKAKLIKSRYNNPGTAFNRAKPPSKRSEAKRAKQQANARKNKPANLIGLAKSGKGANRVKSFHRPSVTPPFGHTRIPVRKLMKRSAAKAKLRTKATKGLLKKGQGIIQSVTTRPRNPKKRKRKEQ